MHGAVVIPILGIPSDFKPPMLGVEISLPPPPKRRGTLVEYTPDGLVVDPNLPNAPVEPGNALPEITVLHVYRSERDVDPRELSLIGYYHHPNPETLAAKALELSQNSNWHVDHIRYVRADLALRVGW